MDDRVALIGAGDKMGLRIARQLRHQAVWQPDCGEISAVGRDRLAAFGLTVRRP